MDTRKGLRTTRSRWVDKDTQRVTLVQGNVELWVDLDRLFDKLAHGALVNKNGKSVLAGGAIQAIAVGREVQTQEVPTREACNTLHNWIKGAA